MQADMNRKITAAQEAGEAVEPVPVCQHLWVVSGVSVIPSDTYGRPAMAHEDER